MTREGYEAGLEWLMEIVRDIKAHSPGSFNILPPSVDRTFKCLVLVAIEVEEDILRYRDGWRLMTPGQVEAAKFYKKVATGGSDD